MNSWTPEQGIACYIMVPPSYRPQVYAAINHSGGTNLLCYPHHSTRPNANEIRLMNGGIDLHINGPDRYDITLDVTGASDEVQALIDELVRRGVPVCIYPRAEGSVQLDMPLVRGTGHEAADATVTHTLTTATGTKVYLPKPDSGRMVYMQEFASGTDLLLDSIPTSTPPAGVMAPLGRGLYMPATGKNLLKESNIQAVTYEAPWPDDGWTWAAGGDTWNTHAGLKASPWRDGGYSYWTRSANNTLKSRKFDISYMEGKHFHFSCCYRVSGLVYVKLYDSDDNYLFTLAAISSGTGRGHFQVLPISSASETDCYIQVEFDSGEYAEIDCMQLMCLGADSEAVGDYLPYLGTDGATQGEITASQLQVLGDWGMDCAPYSGTGSTWDGYICVSGYLQPGYSVAYRGNKTIAFLEKYLGASAGDVELRFRPAGSWYEIALYSGGTRRDGTTLTAAPRRGEVYAWVLFTGLENGSLQCGAYLVNVQSGTTYGLLWTGGGIGVANRLYLGSRSTAGYGADSLLSGVTVCAVPSLASTRTIATRLANTSNIYLFRRTCGRQYRLTTQVKPRRFDTGWEGTYLGTETKAL